VFFALFSACTARITGTLEAGGSGDFEVSASLMPRISVLIRSFSAAMGDGTAPEYIIDGEAVAQSMAVAPGIASVSFRNTGPGVIEGPVKISRLEDFLAGVPGSGGVTQGFITFERALPGGLSRCTITINRESGPEILSLLSLDVSDYLSLLMAPIATGEQMTKSEYFAAVSSVYGPAVADEIRGASISASIQFPGPISAVKGGTWTGNRAAFNIPLADLLVLAAPLVYDVLWQCTILDSPLMPFPVPQGNAD
jgi:hypothetical protein